MRILLLCLFVISNYTVISQPFPSKDEDRENDILAAESIRQGGHDLFNSMQFANSLNEYERALDAFKEVSDSVGMGKCYNNIGNAQLNLGHYEEAIAAFYQAVEINKDLHLPNALIGNYINLAIYYKQQDEYPQSQKYFSQALELSLSLNENPKLTLVYGGLGAILGDPKYIGHNFDSAAMYYTLSLNSYYLSNDTFSISKAYNNLGALMYHQQKYDSALLYYSQSLHFKDAIEDERGKVITLLNMGNVYMDEGNYGLALDYFSRGAELASKYDDKIIFLDLLTNIIKCKIRLGSLEEADSLFVIYNSLNDSIYNQEKAKQLKELEVLYETRKIGNELEDQIRQTKEKTKLSYWFLAVAVGLLLLLTITILLFVQRQRFLQERKVQELDRLKKDQEIIALNAIMQGQEEERNRIAEDLHDRLGARLAAIKLLSEHDGKNNSKLTEMLEASIKETREISHNLSTDMLTRFGLENAISDVVRTINESNKIEGDFTTTNLGDRLPPALEKSLYHIVLELVNNTIKHSGATSFFIQLTRFEDKIDLLYEDDGIGFDLIEAEQIGMGMINLKARVQSIKGSINIDTSPGKGLHVMMDVAIP